MNVIGSSGYQVAPSMAAPGRQVVSGGSVPGLETASMEIAVRRPSDEAANAAPLELLIPFTDVAAPEVSIVVPALNEQMTVGQFVDWCKAGLRDAGVVGEILIVDSST